MTQQSHRLLFTVAAIFNWVIGLGLLLDARLILELMGVSPLPTEPTFVRIVGGLVFLFGFWYYQAGSDLRGVASAIWLGATAKIMVFTLGVFDVITGEISWPWALPVSADLVFALLFIKALRGLDRA
jgi:hypothetical protein